MSDEPKIPAKLATETPVSNFLSPDSVQVKNIALIILSTLAVIFALDWAQSFIITLLLGVLLAYALNPFVNQLERIKINRVIGSSMVILVLIGSLVFAGYQLRDQVQSIISILPEAATKLTSSFIVKRGEPLTNMQKLQIAANQVEAATSTVENNLAKTKKSIMHVVVEEQKFKIGDFLWRGSLGAFGFIGEALTMIFLAYFILLSGDSFKRKLVKITGPSLSNKKITVQIMADINQSIQRYMFMLLVTNIIVGIISWAVFRSLNLENSGAWAVAAGFMHIVPYFGPIATALATGMAAYMQFDSILMALVVSGASILIATIVGVFITTWMTGRIAKMNSAAVFLALIFFSWLWGLWGMLLGIPVIFIIKVVCEHIEHLQPIAELLGD
ncbi:MAG: AI-2E family transporter [Bdellovibrio sp.]|nr:AI-2E family transporter [Methylotenera sp.]